MPEVEMKVVMMYHLDEIISFLYADDGYVVLDQYMMMTINHETRLNVVQNKMISTWRLRYL